MSPAILLAEGANYDGIISAISSAVSVSTISTVLVGATTTAIALVFFWWAARKVTQVIFSAFRSGKLHL